MPWLVAARTLTVGLDHPYRDLAAAVGDAEAGDVIQVSEGLYRGPVRVAVSGLRIAAMNGDRPQFEGRLEVQADGVTIENLEIFGWDSKAGIQAVGANGLRIAGCVVRDAPEGDHGSAGIYLRRCTSSVVENNRIYRCGKGIVVVAGHSTDRSYSGGIQIRGNQIHDNPRDGIDLHGEYLSVVGNSILDNVDRNLLLHHADGIQLIAATVDGYTAVKSCRILGNLIRNHTQNIFLEGTRAGEGSDCRDIHVANNVAYMEARAINGSPILTAVATRNLSIKGGRDVHVYNNTFGDAGSTAAIVYDSADGSITIQNNVFANRVRGGLVLQDPKDLSEPGLDRNLYWNREFAADLGGVRYLDRVSLYFATGWERFGLDADPQLAAFPKPAPIAASPVIGEGIDAGEMYAVDFLGRRRPTGEPWDLGAIGTARSGEAQQGGLDR